VRLKKVYVTAAVALAVLMVVNRKPEFVVREVCALVGDAVQCISSVMRTKLVDGDFLDSLLALDRV
jgi:hypothetical protein